MAQLPIIAVSGPHGSGKSTAARQVAEILGYKYIAAGELFREMAHKESMSLEEYSKSAESNDNIDRFIDERTLEIAKAGGNLVIDAQLSGWVLKDIADLLVFITAPLDLRIKRIAQRENKDYEFIKKETLYRENSEKQRYQKLYKIDISDLSIYDVIINSQKFNATDCVRIIKKAFEKILKGEKK